VRVALGSSNRQSHEDGAYRIDSIDNAFQTSWFVIAGSHIPATKRRGNLLLVSCLRQQVSSELIKWHVLIDGTDYVLPVSPHTAKRSDSYPSLSAYRAPSSQCLAHLSPN